MIHLGCLLFTGFLHPPEIRTLRRARVFGFTAVGIGLLLVFGVFWSMLTH